MGQLDTFTPNMAEHIIQKATLKGHSDWVTAIACPQEVTNADFFLSASRDKSIIYWQVDGHDGQDYAWPKRALRGHSHFVQDVIISQDGQIALSCSWDSTLRLWDLAQGKTTKRFIGHSKDVLSWPSPATTARSSPAPATRPS